jgi:hypothetical protein
MPVSKKKPITSTSEGSIQPSSSLALPTPGGVSSHSVLQQKGDRWGQKTRQRVKKKGRSFQTFRFSSLATGRDHAENSFEKMIFQWGQMSIHAHLSPLVFEG